MSDYLIERDGYEISTDTSRLDLDRIQAFLARAYWAQGRTRIQIETSIMVRKKPAARPML